MKQPKVYPPMSLSYEEHQELRLKLSELEPCIPQMRGASPKFIKDQIEREKEYGPEIRLSPKQWSWIRSLHNEFVGTADDASDRPDGDDGDDCPDLDFAPR